MFHRKKKNVKKATVVTEEMARHIGDEAGMAPEHIAMLLDSLEKIGKEATIVHRPHSAKGRNKPEVMSIDSAVEYELQRARERQRREIEIRESFRKRPVPDEEIKEFSVEDNVYPKRVSPRDIARSLDAARARIALLAGKNMPKKNSIRSEIILSVLEKIKQLEAVRVARQIAKRQYALVEGKDDAAIQREKQETILKKHLKTFEEEAEKAARTLDGFGKGLHTLVDEAAEVVETDLNASAKVLGQWIGNPGETNGSS